MAGSKVDGHAPRWWRRFRRRPIVLQVGVTALIVALIAGAAAGIAIGTSRSDSATEKSGLATANQETPPALASTSSRGIEGDSINVVFPVADLSALSSNLGFAGDPEDAQQVNAINFYVSEINNDGGINGRKIHAIISNFDPTNEADMRALCKDWTEGSPQAFAVVDGLGAWSGDNELCITQEGHTPFIGEWTTVSNWTSLGSPYLWWLGPDQAVILHTLVTWAASEGYIGSDKKLGILAGDRTSDQLALNDYLLPYLKHAGISHPLVETIATDPSDVATTASEAPLIVQRLRADGVDTVIPLVPVNGFFPYLQAETAQQYFPRLLLSDYESTISIGLGLIPYPFEKALDNQEGVTVQTLGGIDDDRPESKGGYDPGVRSCFDSFRKSASYPFPAPPVHPGPWIEEQGPIASWCQAIRLFAEAAQKAGRDLNRRTFLEAMASVENYPGTLSPELSYGVNKFYGPVEYRVVRIHNNSASDNQCINNYRGGVQATCWVVVQNWRPLAISH
ncbi:MAG TPA: ABC transporter substrate-binding protein [Acidimicrobiales bacterium]|nr:ABC transporter substrate-binding protein [Acidimicrobiales bacterium]